MIFNKFIKLSLILVLLLNNSCISRQVKKDRGYRETFKGFFISKRDGEVVFIGKKYHYIFKDKSKTILNIVNSESAKKLKISKLHLSLDKNNKINGYVELMFVLRDKPLADQDKNFIKKQDFIQNNQGEYIKKIWLDGIRYASARGFDENMGKLFSRNYETKIYYDKNNLQKATKATLTPIAYAADGILIVVGGVWVPLAIIAFSNEDTPERFFEKLVKRTSNSPCQFR